MWVEVLETGYRFSDMSLLRSEEDATPDRTTDVDENRDREAGAGPASRPDVPIDARSARGTATARGCGVSRRASH